MPTRRDKRPSRMVRKPSGGPGGLGKSSGRGWKAFLAVQEGSGGVGGLSGGPGGVGRPILMV